MIRTAAREIAIQLGFAAAASGQEPETVIAEFFEPEHYESMADEGGLYAEAPSKKDLAFITQCVTGVCARREELDGIIGRYAKGWRPERISRSAAAVLRQAIFELLYMPDIPAAASINEAVELAKGYEDADVVAFVNGVLGGFYRAELESRKSTPAEDAPAPTDEAPAEVAADA